MRKSSLHENICANGRKRAGFGSLATTAPRRRGRCLVPFGHRQFTDSLAAILTDRYAALVADCGPEPDDEEGLARLRALCMDLMRLRRGDHSYRRVRIMEGATRGIPAAQVLDYFVRWAQQPQIKQWICDGETRFPKKLATLKALLRVGSRSDRESENPTLTPENPTKSD